MHTSPFAIRETEGFRYLDEGSATDLPPVLLLHGMLGDLSNWTATVRLLSQHQYRVLVPILPVYELPLKQTHVPGLVAYVRAFVEMLGLPSVVPVGNSLGGQVAILYTLFHAESVAALILSGSSGVYEAELGVSTPRRKDRDYIRERAAVTFFDPVHATDELVDEMVALMNDRPRVLRLIRMARSTKRETVADRLAEIDVPTLLVWGRNDIITPPDVAQEFHEHIPRSQLHFIDRCGHAPMLERPEAFNRITLDFLRETVGRPVLASSRNGR